MSIKHHFVRLAEKITGRKCCRCAFNCDGKCTHPHPDAFANCWQTMSKPAFTTKNEGREPATAWAMDKGCMAPGDMTEEEKYQLGKIVESLQEASTTAQDAGLLDDKPHAPAIPRMDEYWDDRAESGLLEDE